MYNDFDWKEHHKDQKILNGLIFNEVSHKHQQFLFRSAIYEKEI